MTHYLQLLGVHALLMTIIIRGTLLMTHYLLLLGVH